MVRFFETEKEVRFAIFRVKKIVLRILRGGCLQQTREEASGGLYMLRWLKMASRARGKRDISFEFQTKNYASYNEISFDDKGERKCAVEVFCGLLCHN